MDGLIILLPIALLALIFFSGRKRTQQAAAVQRQLSPGTEIVTTAGLYATIVEVEDDSVVLESSPGVQSRWARAAVARVTSTVEDVAAADAEDSEDAAVGAPGAIDADSYAVPDDLSELDADADDRTRSSNAKTSHDADDKDLDPRAGGSSRGGIDDPGGRRP